MSDKLTERKCKGCGNSGDLITFYDDATEYCNMCEYDNIPLINRLKTENAALVEALKGLLRCLISNITSRGTPLKWVESWDDVKKARAVLAGLIIKEVK